MRSIFRRLPPLILGVALAAGLGAGGLRPHPGLGKLRWVGLGGGSSPDSNQLSIEQDLELARAVLGEPVALLYAGGAGTRAVQVRDPEVKGDPLVARLGHLFAPRGGRDARYQPTSLKPSGPARADDLEEVLALELKREGTTTLYVAAHGESSEAPADALIRLWGGWSVGVPDLAAVADAAPEAATLRLILTSCYSGGFSEVLFREGDAAQGPGPGALRCGLFATTWERQASGCDPDPDRRVHEGYGIHFLHALKGEDREGKPLEPGLLDLDGDRRVSLLEAHTRVRLVSKTLDVPTTTSERWLRQAAPERGPSKEVDLPEERRVVKALEASLGLDARAASRKLEAARLQLQALELQAERARQETDEAWWDLSGLLLSRWPVLDDPYHPAYPALLAEEREAILKLLDTHPLSRAYQTKRAVERGVDAKIDALLLESAGWERLARAAENLELAGRLAAAGGEDWEHFQRLRACERGL
ncbi:MAG: hypothetical protein P1V51_01760 [Deltaproteobacteria bacterium]|nr:hypothetical protein [Deltaproteobacteria bacterium]